MATASPENVGTLNPLKEGVCSLVALGFLAFAHIVHGHVDPTYSGPMDYNWENTGQATLMLDWTQFQYGAGTLDTGSRSGSTEAQLPVFLGGTGR